MAGTLSKNEGVKMIDFFESWAEFFFFVLLVIGFIFSVFAPSAFLSYIMIFACGGMAGRLMYERKKKLQFPYYLIIVGFLIGYIIGAYYGNKIIILALFVLGGVLSYYLHDKGIIRDVRY